MFGSFVDVKEVNENAYTFIFFYKTMYFVIFFLDYPFINLFSKIIKNKH